MTTALHILGALLRWAVASPWHALGTVALGAIVAARLSSRPAPQSSPSRRSGGVATVLVAAGALLTGWWFLAHPQKSAPPAAAPKPVTRTIYVHQTVTKVVHAAGHSGLPPWAIVVIVIVALGALCGLTLGRSSES
jgi:uncharacterized membrane protein AbrB (regulator of aidB expression)